MLLFVAVALAVEPASPDYPGHCQSPRWSPDGRYLAWEVNYLQKQAVELYVQVFGSGGPPRRIAPVSRSASSLTAGFSTATDRMVVHELSFSPGSLNRFVYSSSGAAEDYDLYVDGLGAIAVAGGADGNPSWSPDGKRIAFTSARTGQGDLYVLDVAALEAAPLRISGDPVASEVYAAWSPDSKSLAFVGHTQKGDNLYVVPDLAFPAPRALTSWPHVQTHPAWSPLGGQIAFYSNHENPDRFDLYVTGLDGAAKLLATDVIPNTNGPAWTADGRWIVYVKHDDDAFSPVWAAPVSDAGSARMIPTGTVGNADIDVVRRADGKSWLAVAAQGRVGDPVRDFRRIYAMALSLP
jgi:Tol biopolymer transport system component